MVYRIYVEKKAELAHEANSLLSELRGLIGIKALESVRILNRYDADNITNIHKGGHVTANKLLWTLGNYSRFIRPGYVRVALEGADELDGLAASAFISPESDELVVVMVNSSFDVKPVEFNLPKDWKKDMTSVTSYTTDERRDLVADVKGRDLSHVIAPRSITTFVIRKK